MKLKLLTAALLGSAHALRTPFANTNAGRTLWMCATSQPTAPANAAAYAGLTWVQIKGVGEVGETGSSTNILTYDTWDTDVIDKAKGMTDAGSPTIECARIALDDGQIALRAAANTNLKYAFKIEGNDEPEVGGSPSIFYHYGLVSGPTRPNGRNEDFDLEVFTLGLTAKETVVAPADAP